MTDIVERLRRKVFSNPQVGAPHLRTVEWQAADEIERLRDIVEAALESIDADDVIGAHDKLRAALGEKE